MEYKARYLYSELAQAISAFKGMDKSHGWYENWKTRIKMFEDMMPSGSGFDTGTKIDLDASHADKLVFHTSFHHMNDGGYYDGWTEHTVTVTPSFIGDYHIRVTGRNRNEIKDYIAEQFGYVLGEDVTYELYREHFPQFALSAKWENEDGSASQCYQAWYVNGQRFWNSPDKAKEYASRLMAEEWSKPRNQ